MLEFMTLFLGLVAGEHEVALSTVGPVAEVEVRLDGETLAVLKGEPWTLTCDFGSLAPHELVAVARDALGRELDRARQWINIVQSTVDAAMTFTADDVGKPTAVRLSWEVVGKRRPQAVEVFFDGRPLQVDDPRHVPLPAYDLGDFHFVSAEIRFSDRESRRLEAAFGGERSGEISSELTALAVTVDPGAGLPGVRELQSWFLVDGEPVKVHGVERRTPQIVLVRDPEVQPFLDRLAQRQVAKSFQAGRQPGSAALVDWDPARFFTVEDDQLRKNLRRYQRELQGLRGFAAPGEAVSWRFVSPVAAPIFPDGVTPAMFLHSESRPGDSAGFLSLTQEMRPPEYPIQLADAVALAGMLAHASGTRRAVVLLTTEVATEHDQFDVATVTAYLRELQVPLFVWSFDSANAAGWGEVRHFGSADRPARAFRELAQAVDEIYRRLERQRVVWLKGRHLPRSIAMSPAAREIRRAGS